MMSRHSAITALDLRLLGKSGEPASWPGLAISMPIEAN
jgi:hypothetical protein